MKLASWNVNGIRSVYSKKFEDWFAETKADAVCLQEIKARPEQLDEAHLHPMGYHSYWHPAEKPGYSGLVIYSRKEPLKVEVGMGIREFDQEGRVLIAEYDQYYLVNTYFPNSQREHERLPYKLAFCAAIEEKLEDLRRSGKQVLICGDFNIAHKPIDLKNPKQNEKNAGFLPEERAWMDRFTGLGWVDTFRKFNEGPDFYTWWSYRPTIRERNIGWRLDYFFSNPESVDRVKSMIHQDKVLGSDHCPVLITLKK